MDRFGKIQQQIAQLQPDFKVEKIALENALNRVLQEDIIADLNMPPFHKSAMDGYACHAEDIENTLEIQEVINAGKLPSKKVGKNQCSKIMTGAAVPEGCDCVFKIEDAEQVSEKEVRCLNKNTAGNICFLGEDYRKGDVLLKKGTIIHVAQMAVLAGAGYAKVKVSARPEITVIATGSELVPPERVPQPGQIRNSNALQLISQLKKMNLGVIDNFIVGDNFQVLTEKFINALNKSDYIFFTGGASVGDFDFIPEILKTQGFRVFWDRTGIKPGNPMTFSQKGNKYCFGLSGNPVSSMVQFQMIAKPVIYKLLGAQYTQLRVKGTLAFDFHRKKTDRMAIIPVSIGEKGLIDEISFHGSAHINALTRANALLEVPLGVNTIKKGESGYVRPL